MKTNYIELISKSNKVIFFVCSITFIIFLATIFIKGLMRQEYSNRGVEITQRIDKETAPINIKYEKNYYRSIKDIHIIKVTSERILVNDSQSHGKLYSLFSGGYDDRNTVNLIFASDNGTNIKLFENDLLITNIETAQFTKIVNSLNLDALLLDRNIYTVVAKDSNGDGYLKYDDSKDLYLSDYNGENLELIMSDIETSRVIKDNHLLISKFESNISEMYIYDVVNGNMAKLNTYIK